MLGVVIAAAMTPDVGLVSAQTSTPYSVPSAAPSGLSTYAWLGIAAVLIVAGLLAALFLMRRRRKAPPAAVPPVAAGGPPPGAAGTPPPPAPPVAAPAYLETPEDVGQTLPVVPTPPAPAAPGAAAGAGAEAEPDIDSLMAELDKISGEILKRAPKKGAEKPPETKSDEGSSP